MVVTIRKASERGDDRQVLDLRGAQKEVGNQIQMGWIAAVKEDGKSKQVIPEEIKDGDEVSLYPNVVGG